MKQREFVAQLGGAAVQRGSDVSPDGECQGCSRAG
jgi:hypothetical protein